MRDRNHLRKGSTKLKAYWIQTPRLNELVLNFDWHCAAGSAKETILVLFTLENYHIKIVYKKVGITDILRRSLGFI